MNLNQLFCEMIQYYRNDPLILQRLYSKMFFSFFFSYAIICGAANIYTYTFRILSKEGFLHG